MGLISNLLSDLATQPAVDYTFHPIPSLEPDSAIIADQHYLRIWLRSARIVNVREWTSKFHAVIHARFTYTDRGEGTREVASTIAPASSFEELDAANLDRFITINRLLLGPIPYRGQIGMEVALLSVKAADLAKPYLDFLLSLSETAGISLLSALQPFAAPIRQGAEFLFKNKDYSRLEIGLDKTDTALGVCNIIVARAPKNEVDFADIKLDPRDWRLTNADGSAVTVFPYMVLGIEKVVQRNDYSSIKDIRDSWDAIRSVAQEGRPAAEIEERFAQLRRVVWLSSDLVDCDKSRILKIFRNNLAQAGFRLGETMQEAASIATEAYTAPALSSLKSLAEIFGEQTP